MSRIIDFIGKNLTWLSVPRIEIIDIVEIIIISFLVYSLLRWIKQTRAWMLLRGIIVLALFILIAYVFRMHTILWLAAKSVNVAFIAAVIVFQPELRKALEQLGQKKYFSALFPDQNRESGERFSDRTLNELIKATMEMSKEGTGALIVIAQNINLDEYERTGIALDSILSSQLLLNIFENKTPLHDGAIIVQGNRITAATCYLPLSDNMRLSKDLGTRHRAGVGISEVTDSMTVVVSEETGAVSVAYKGILYRNLNSDTLKEKLLIIQNKNTEVKRFKLWKGRLKNEKVVDK